MDLSFPCSKSPGAKFAPSFIVVTGILIQITMLLSVVSIYGLFIVSLCSCSSSCIGATSIFDVLSKYADLSLRFCADFLRSSWPFSFEYYKGDFMIPIRLATSRLREHRMRQGRSRSDRKRATKSRDERRKPRVVLFRLREIESNLYNVGAKKWFTT